ncbi:MAG: TetR/AcrR family transcriptional regulator [Streptosporangiaceae bacterium]
MTAQVHDGRANQKLRTRSAIIEAARGLAKSGAEITMPAVATAALVSEATAYRYFPDLPSLLREALAGVWLSSDDALHQVGHSDDPVERVGYATSYLLHHVHAYQGAVRATIAADITRPGPASVRPGQRFALIDQALAPVESSFGQQNPAAFESLKRELAIVVSAEAFFTLTDLCGLPPEEAIAHAVHAAQTITTAALALR